MKLKKVVAIGIVAAMAVSLVACGGTKITEIEIEPELAMGTGESYQMEVTYKAKNEEDVAKIEEATKDYVLDWSSSNVLVATVDENGIVTALGDGDTVITVSVKDHDKLKATCNVTVESKVTGVDVPSTMNIGYRWRSTENRSNSQSQRSNGLCDSL